MKKNLFLILSIIFILLLSSCSGQKTRQENQIETIETTLNEQESGPETKISRLNITGLTPDRGKGYSFRDYSWGDTPESLKEKFKDIPYEEETDNILFGSVSITCREIVLDHTATVVYRFYNGLFFVNIELKVNADEGTKFFERILFSFTKNYGEPAETMESETDEKTIAAAWEFGTTDYFLLGIDEKGETVSITYLNPERFTAYKNSRDSTINSRNTFSDIFESMKSTELSKLLKLKWGNYPEDTEFLGRITKEELKDRGRSAVVTQSVFQNSMCYLQYLFIDKMLCHVSIIVPLPSISGVQANGTKLYEETVKQIESKNGQPEFTHSDVAKKWWILPDGSTLLVTLNRRSDNNEMFVISLQDEILFSEYEKAE